MALLRGEAARAKLREDLRHAARWVARNGTPEQKARARAALRPESEPAKGCESPSR